MPSCTTKQTVTKTINMIPNIKLERPCTWMAVFSFYSTLYGAFYDFTLKYSVSAKGKVGKTWSSSGFVPAVCITWTIQTLKPFLSSFIHMQMRFLFEPVTAPTFKTSCSLTMSFITHCKCRHTVSNWSFFFLVGRRIRIQSAVAVPAGDGQL